MYWKDIQIGTIELHDPWCHGTLDINYMGVMERQALMPRVIIDKFLHALTHSIYLVLTNIFIR